MVQGDRWRGFGADGQYLLQGMIDELMDGAAVTETDFGLGRVDIDIDESRINGQEQAAARLPATMQLVTIGFANGMLNHLVAHVAAVNESKLGFTIRQDRGRNHGPALEL